MINSFVKKKQLHVVEDASQWSREWHTRIGHWENRKLRWYQAHCGSRPRIPLHLHLERVISEAPLLCVLLLLSLAGNVVTGVCEAVLSSPQYLYHSHRLRIKALLSSGCRAAFEGLPNARAPQQHLKVAELPTVQIAIACAVLAKFKNFTAKSTQLKQFLSGYSSFWCSLNW